MMVKGLLKFYRVWLPGEFNRDIVGVPMGKGVRVLKRTCRTAESVYSFVRELENARLHGGLHRAGRDIIGSVVDQITKKPDRIFLDFDIIDSTFDRLKKELRIGFLEGDESLIVDSQEKLRDCVFSSKKLKKCFERVMEIKAYFIDHYNLDLAVFFSGAKGFHLYIPLYPKKHEYYNEALTFLAKTINEVFGAPVDLAVCRDALVRKARIPYTPNMKTGLYCVPVLGDEDLSVVLERSESPGEAVQNFGLPRPSNSLEKLVELCEDYVIEEEKTRLKRRNLVLKKEIIVVSDGDLREAFRAILGEPAYSSEDYDQYHCPFPTHDDFNPSFTVWGSYWKCFGCLREGANLERFKKEYERSK
ncbi:MAG: hypothetical protein AB7U40_08595, partial [Methanobacteriales archaeon]